MNLRSHISSLIAFSAIVTIIGGPLQLLAQQLGHRVSSTAVTIDRRTEWAQWDVAGGTVEITDDGSVEPRFMRKNVNAALDATAYGFEADGQAVDDGPGGVYVGSNAQDAHFLIDGDMTTTWGPTPTEESFKNREWWAEINLGRLVVVNKVVLRFALEGEGDPFLQFKVLGWRHPPTRGSAGFWVVGTLVPRYWELGRTEKPNKDQRVFEFVPDAESRNGNATNTEPLIQASSNFAGDALERVQIVITDSDLDRAVELTSDEGEDGLTAQAKYEALDVADRGAIEHYRQEPSGRETLITEAGYQTVNEDRRGRIRYFRREIPKLAEVEVWTPGDNMIIGLGDRGGKVEIEFPSPGLGWKEITSAVSDAKFSTSFSVTLFRHFGPTDFVADLGALYWVDTMQFLHDGKEPIEEFAVDISDGTRAPDGSIKWTRAAGEITGLAASSFERGVGGSGVVGKERALKFRQFDFDPTLVRFLRGTMMTARSDPGGGGVLGTFVAFTDFMLYGEGFVPQLVLESGFIDLRGGKNINTIEWEADLDPGAKVQLQTRSGNELTETLRYFDSDGNPIEPIDDPVKAKRNYDRKPSSKQGEIKSFFSAGGDWSPWSRPYRSSGETVASPSPREFMQVRATLLSDNPQSAASLHSINVNLSEPVADRLVGEVWPTLVAEIAKPQDVSFYVRPFFGSSSQQFDELRIEATGGTVMELVEARIGSDEEFARDEPTVYLPAELEVMDGPDSTIQFRLPGPIDRGIDLLEIRFRPTTFSTNTNFRASGQDSNNPGLWQRVDAGDATDLVNSQTTAVLALEGNDVISDVAISTPVITPNADGVNDVMSFNFNVARINSQQTVRVTIFDLSGAMVKEISEGRADPRGPYSITWLGDDAADTLVPPGIYLARIEVDVDSGSATATSVHRLVQVAY